MKNLLHNISIMVVLALMMVGIQSCSDDWQEVGDVRVSFTATLPTDTRTRSFGKAELVNTLVVGVFKKGVADVHTNSSGNWIFWAYDSNQNIYNIDDLTAIEMNALPNPITFTQAEAADAFFATMGDITITGDCSYPVELVRPLAQINVGTTGTPMQASFTAKDVPDTFHPFTNTASGVTDYTWNFSEITTETFSVKDNDGNETVYNYLAMGYLFAPTTATKVTAELILTDGNASKTIQFPQVEIEANQRSNIAGNFTATE